MIIDVSIKDCLKRRQAIQRKHLLRNILRMVLLLNLFRLSFVFFLIWCNNFIFFFGLEEGAVFAVFGEGALVLGRSQGEGSEGSFEVALGILME